MKYISVFGNFTGCFLPEWLLKRKELSMSSKVVYARLVYYGGEKGIAFPHVQTLANSVGLYERHVRRCINELIKLKLIHRERRGKSYTYRFLYHDWMKNTPELYNLSVDNSDKTCDKCKLKIETPVKMTGNTGQNDRCTESDTLLYEEKKENKHTSSLQLDACIIFDYWKKVMNHPRAKFDAKRKKKIEAAGKLGYSEADIKQAIEGCFSSPFHQGQNTSKTKYDNIDLILRDAEHIEKFMEIARLNKSKTPLASVKDPKLAIEARKTKIKSLKQRLEYLNNTWPSASELKAVHMKHATEVGEIEAGIDVLEEQIKYFEKRL